MVKCNNLGLVRSRLVRLDLQQHDDGGGQAQTTENVGRQIVWDMAAEGSGAYGKGKIFAPDSGKTYNGKMELDGDRLKVSGCVMGICPKTLHHREGKSRSRDRPYSPSSARSVSPRAASNSA